MSHFPKCQWRKLKTALILLALVPSPAFAEPTLEGLQAERERREAERELMQRARALTDQEIEQFKLYNGCRPMRIIVWISPDSTETSGLEEKGLRATLESRLRAARLYREEAPNVLVLDVASTTGASRIRLAYGKIIYDMMSEHLWWADTWATWRLTENYDAPSLMSEVSQMMDLFIAGYLRVNEKACASR